jgi:TRAP-type mannitol/chloroaromatic compound transport system permease small subunit
VAGGTRDRLVRAIDALSERTGRVVAWLLVLLIAICSFNAIARWGGRSLGVNLSSNAYLELQWYLFAAVFLLGGAATLKHNAHVRVDVLHDRFPPRVRRAIDIAGAWLLLIPFCALFLWISLDPVLHSIELREDSPDPGGLPRYWVKPLVPLGFSLLLLQGVAEALRRRDAPPRSEARP